MGHSARRPTSLKVEVLKVDEAAVDQDEAAVDEAVADVAVVAMATRSGHRPEWSSAERCPSQVAPRGATQTSMGC